MQSTIGSKNKYTNHINIFTNNKSVGYVSQNHWMQNKSIRDNILFGKEYDEVFY